MTFGLTDLPADLAEQIEVSSDGCWRMTRWVYSKGYARYKGHAAHRFAFALAYGWEPIQGLTVDHACHTNECPNPGVGCLHRRCINPAHLRPMTAEDNAARARGEKTHCPRGHEYTRVALTGWRVCGVCANERAEQKRRAAGVPAKARPECPQGHLYTEENTRYYGKRRTKVCKTCEDERRAKLVAQKHAAGGGIAFGLRTECVNGHPFDEANTRVVRKSGGGTQRQCIACQREAVARYRARKRAQA